MVALSQDFSVQYVLSKVPECSSDGAQYGTHDLEGLKRLEALYICTARFGRCPTAMMIERREWLHSMESTRMMAWPAEAFDTKYC